MENTIPNLTTEPTDSLSASPTQIPPNPKSNAMLIIMLVMLLVTAIGAGSYYFLQYQKLLSTPKPTPTPLSSTSQTEASATTDQTAKWKTYSNTKFNYQFKYPQNIKIDGLVPGEKTSTVTQESKGLLIYPEQTNTNKAPSLLMQIETDSAENISRKPYDQWLEDAKRSFNEAYGYASINTVDFNSVTMTKLDGYHAYPKSATPVRTYLFQSPSNVYFSIMLAGNTEEDFNVFDQILSTLNFTNPQPTTNTWKTYTNNTYSYTLSYPEGWVVDDSKADDASFAPIEISKDNHRLTITYLEGFGPSLCLFDDQARAGAPEFANYCEGNYVELAQGIRRRLEKPVNTGNGKSSWSIYTKEPASEYFVTVPPINYSAPANYDPKLVKIMDDILATFTTIL